MLGGFLVLVLIILCVVGVYKLRAKVQAKRDAKHYIEVQKQIDKLNKK